MKFSQKSNKFNDEYVYQGETTKVSPFDPYDYQIPAEVDVNTLKMDLIHSRANGLKINLLPRISQPIRRDCIRMLSRICGELHLRE